MPSLALPPDLDERLRRQARRLGKSPQECAQAALRVWLDDHEEAERNAALLGGDGVARPIDDHWD